MDATQPNIGSLVHGRKFAIQVSEFTLTAALHGELLEWMECLHCLSMYDEFVWWHTHIGICGQSLGLLWEGHLLVSQNKAAVQMQTRATRTRGFPAGAAS